MEAKHDNNSNVENSIKDLTSGMDALNIAKEEAEIKHFIIESKAHKYDGPTDELQAAFANIDYNTVNGITLSGNSYGTDACRWIADNVLKSWKGLKYVDFSNIFISRLKEDLPISLKLLMDAIHDKQIQHLDLSHNAFGPQGVASFEHFL